MSIVHCFVYKFVSLFRVSPNLIEVLHAEKIDAHQNGNNYDERKMKQKKLF